MTPQQDQKLWNFFFAVLYAVLLGWLISSLDRYGSRAFANLSVFQFTLLSLAAFRLTRLFVYDEITVFLRSLFYDKETVTDEGGNKNTVEKEPARGPRKTLAHLFRCPWCAGVWTALLIAYVVASFEWGWVVVVILAIAGVATFIQLLANMIGWRAENLKVKTEHKH